MNTAKARAAEPIIRERMPCPCCQRPVRVRRGPPIATLNGAVVSRYPPSFEPIDDLKDAEDELR